MWDNIEKERKSAGINKEQMCKQVGITVRTYWNYIEGKPIPSDKLIAMARLFNCSTDYLLGLTDRRTTA